MWFPKEKNDARKVEKSVDNGKAFVALLTDLSKAF